jgi:mannose-1-phosphate guanylyltransferase
MSDEGKESCMYCVIMAGGSGTRFWPRSREARSKQFLPIIGKKSLLQQTINRFEPIVSRSNILVVAKKTQQALLEKTAAKIPPSNLIFEPVGKDTAPCIGLAAITVNKRDPDAVCLVTPADHTILEVPKFRKSILAAVQLAKEEDGFVTLGIVPDRPATGYGYIQIGGKMGSFYRVEAYRVKTFAEKPNHETAVQFLRSGDFLWNSGIFVFRTSVLLRAMEEFLPDLYEGLQEIEPTLDTPDYEAALARLYGQIRSISMDFGIMEKAANVFCIKATFQWSDLGSWEQVYKLSQKDEHGNAVVGNAVLVDTRNAYVYSSDGMVAAVGLENVVVVQEDGVTLVCGMDNTEDVKKVVDRLKRKRLSRYL